MTEHLPHDRGFRYLLDAARDAMIIIDGDDCVLALNRETERLFEWKESELVGGTLDRLIPGRFHRMLDEERESVESMSPRPLPNDTAVSLFAHRRDGTEFPVEISRSPLGSDDSAPTLITIRDLTEWQRARARVFRGEGEQALSILESMGDAVITTNAQGKITFVNRVAEHLTGWRAVDALGQPLDSVLALISDATRLPVQGTAIRCLREGRAVEMPAGVLLLRRDGTEIPIGDSAAPIQDRSGATTGVVLVFYDESEKRFAARRLSHDATHDALTGLVNRAEFDRRLIRILSDPVDPMAEHVVCYMDLDRFKVVNDSCGHEAGDDLLRQIGALLGQHTRKRDTLARLGGDEFGALLENCPMNEAKVIAEELRVAVEEFEFVCLGRSFSLGASIGLISVTAGENRRASSVLRAADAACYAAKEAGGNCIHLGPEGEGPEALLTNESRRITRLARAVDEGLFRLVAQAIVPLAPERHSRPRCEVLLRLPDERGVLQPAASFLPQAERYNLMPAIDRWVIRQTIALLGRWNSKHSDCELPLCSINVSSASLEEDDLPDLLLASLERHRVPPEALCLEISEAAALTNFARAVRFITQVRAAGCAVALCDFGHRPTSFSHLKALPADFLKIGGHFVRGVAEDPVYSTIVGAVNQIGRVMGIATIAQEVDSETVLHKLRDLGVGYAQGHAVSSPELLGNLGGEDEFPCIQRSA